MTYLLFALATLLGGIVQGTTGFGAGVVAMLVLPYLLPLPEAAGISGAMAIGICGMMAYRYRQAINWQNILVPSLAYVLASLTAIRIAPSIDTVTLKIAFAIFLLVLSAYFLLVKDGLTLKANLATKLLVGLLSGLSDGFFGIGGPLMVVLYLAFSKTREEYLGTLQVSFLIVCLVNMGFRVSQGVLQVAHLPYIGLGVIMMALGLQVANRINECLNAQLLRQSTYLLIGVSGLITLATTLVGR